MQQPQNLDALLRPAQLLCPAKINLWLHIDGRRADGYHFLDSGVCFADWGDVLTITPSQRASLSVSGQFAAAVPADEGNLVFKALALLERLTGCAWPLAISLEKNIPVGAGLGGGSSNAAALLRYAAALLPQAAVSIKEASSSLGADTPVCYYGQAAHVYGIGEQLNPMKLQSDIPALLLFCGQSLSTPEVYLAFRIAVPQLPPAQQISPIPAVWNLEEGASRNDLENAALSLLPALRAYRQALEELEGVTLVRLSGSGSALFALFDDSEKRDSGLLQLKQQYPKLWLQAVSLNPAAPHGDSGRDSAGRL